MVLLLQALQKTTPLMRQQQAYRYTPLRTNFFTLLRFDFMLDENLDTYLIEVRHTCNHHGILSQPPSPTALPHFGLTQCFVGGLRGNLQWRPFIRDPIEC
jgi:hypothetical protein